MAAEYQDALFGSIRFGTDQIFSIGAARIAVEICEDAWAVVPPSAHHALAGANVIVNISASKSALTFMPPPGRRNRAGMWCLADTH